MTFTTADEFLALSAEARAREERQAARDEAHWERTRSDRGEWGW